jgi:hydroxymethylpyrimidine/phosphomethylpyrimidine kinase
MNIALTIAASDSGGGAGIQADLKTFQRFGVFGVSAVTAITAQNTLGVRQWESVSPRMVRAQIEAVAADLFPAAFKTGMLGTAAVARAVVKGITDNSLANYVFDPVMIATSGARLADDDVLRIMRDELLPLASIVTPNAAEAAQLTGRPIRSPEDAERAADHLVNQLGAGAALVTGGHLSSGEEIVDVLYSGALQTFRAARIDSKHTHGTGCTLSAAITAGIANGDPLLAAVEAAIAYVRAAITSAPGLGSGFGPLDHSARTDRA